MESLEIRPINSIKVDLATVMIALKCIIYTLNNILMTRH